MNIAKYLDDNFITMNQNSKTGNSLRYGSLKTWASPFHCFGLVDYVSSHDDFPMNVTWKLRKPAMAQYLKAI